LFGPGDFARMNAQPGTMDHDAADSPESQLIGGPVQSHPHLVARANPITYAGAGDPPFLIVHGSADRTVLLSQSELLYQALRAAGVQVALHIVSGAGHRFQGATPAQRAQIDRWVDAFFDRHLGGGAASG
jgi:dipeptidyl aminopeptidase/acylaminoacyl peptidase